jgi:hypothetical protein
VKTKTPAQIMQDGILSCGHAAEREEDKIILDQCFECDWMTEERRISNTLNSASDERAKAETELIEWCRSNGSHGYDKDMMTELFERAIRVNLRYGRQEAICHYLKTWRDGGG